MKLTPSPRPGSEVVTVGQGGWFRGQGSGLEASGAASLGTQFSPCCHAPGGSGLAPRITIVGVCLADIGSEMMCSG